MEKKYTVPKSTSIGKCDIANPDMMYPNDGSPEITGDIFDYRIGITEIGLSENIKAIFVFAVNKSFGCLERRSNAGLKKIQKGGLRLFFYLFNGQTPVFLLSE